MDIAKTLGLPAKSAQFFVDLASDAGNWSGTPWLSGNLAPGKGSSAMSQTLVKHGLIDIHSSDDGTYATFTLLGVEAAAKAGIDLRWLDKEAFSHIELEASDEPGSNEPQVSEPVTVQVRKDGQVPTCKKNPEHGPHRVTRTGSYCYTCDREIAERQKAERQAAKLQRAIEAHEVTPLADHPAMSTDELKAHLVEAHGIDPSTYKSAKEAKDLHALSHP